MTHKITTFVIAETSRTYRGKEAPATAPVKSAPHYFEKSVPTQFILGQETIEIDGKPVEFIVKAYHPDIVLVESSMVVADVFDDKIFELKEKLLDACYELAKKRGAKEEPAEEYTAYQVFDYKGDPELILKENSHKVAVLLKSEKRELDENEVEHTLSFHLKYAKDDLIIVDWDGAFVFDPDGETGETIEMLQLANLQLLRYRVLDDDLDERLQKVSKLTQETETRKWFRTKEVTQAFQEVIKIRSQSIAQFEAMERSIKLIGDWYSARLYDLLAKKFRLEEWRSAIKDKLDSLEDIYVIISENLGISKMYILELIQIWGFFVLQVGWVILIVMEFVYYTK